MIRKPLRYRVEDRGYDSPCWVWALSRSRGGYGTLLHEGQCRHAHRVYWEERNGPVPHGLELDHLCRVRACCNPDHLEPVTHAENNRRGALTKLSWGDVAVIWSSDESSAELARRFDVSKTLVCDIRKGKRWRREHAPNTVLEQAAKADAS